MGGRSKTSSSLRGSRQLQEERFVARLHVADARATAERLTDRLLGE